MLEHEVKHVLIIAVSLDAEDDQPVGDGCSIGVFDRFIDLLPHCSHQLPLFERRLVGYECMTVAYDLDEE